HTISFNAGQFVAGDILSVFGGDVLSDSVNVNAGEGKSNVFVQNIPGLLNITTHDSSFGAHTPNLLLGNMKISGDPTWFNIGNITLANNIDATEDVAIFATGDIDLGAFRVTSDNNDAAGVDGHPITIVAGAKLVTTGAATGAGVSNPPAGAAITGGTVQVVGGSASGGDILCNGCYISSRSINSGVNGGRVLLAAYNGLASTGDVDLTNSLVRTSAASGA